MTDSPAPTSIPAVCDVAVFAGAEADASAPSLLLEVPHGATETAHYFDLKGLLKSDLPAHLERFFYVNTDIGSAEVADAVARRLVAADPTLAVLRLRCLIPRTFIDCNRIIDANPAAYAEGGVTPGMPPYIDHPDDIALLMARYTAYQAQARAAYEQVCGAGGRAVMLHTYAPKTVGIKKVDRHIVDNLAAVYQPGPYATWPLRPEVDVLTKTLEGEDLSDRAAVDGILAALQRRRIPAGEGQTYPLHPVTTAFHHASRYRGQTVCLEIRRDQLFDFVPFVPLAIRPERVALFAEALMEGLTC